MRKNPNGRLTCLQKTGTWGCHDVRETRKNLALVLKTQNPLDAATLDGPITINHSLIRTQAKTFKNRKTSHKLYIPGIKRNDKAGTIETNNEENEFLLAHHTSWTDTEKSMYVVENAKTIRHCNPENETERLGIFKTTFDVFQDSMGVANSPKNKKKMETLIGGLTDIDQLLLNKIIFEAVKSGCKTLYFKSVENCPLIDPQNQEMIIALKNRGFITQDKYIGNGYVARLNTNLISAYLQHRQGKTPKPNPAFNEINEQYNIKRTFDKKPDDVAKAA